jgi:transposase-like protein
MAIARRNILLNPVDRDKFVRGVNLLKQDFSAGVTTQTLGFAGTPIPVSAYDQFVIWHYVAMNTLTPDSPTNVTGRNSAHRGPIFLPWHRFMLLLFERDCCTEGRHRLGMLKLMRRIRRVRPVLPPPSAFTGFRFPREVIVLAVRWYLRYGLSYRDVEELLAERGITVDHVTVYRWVQRFTPLLIDAARPCRHVPGDCWFVDETYVKVAGKWVYLYRAIDQFGQVIDVLVSEKRNLGATRRFFTRALEHGPCPSEVSIDQAPAYPRGSMSCCRRRAMSWSSTPRIRSSLTMDGSSPDCGRCAG